MMTEYNLDPIFEYHMTEEETLAYKLGLLWMVISNEIFPDYKYACRFPKKGDPRKCILFKFCWKLMNETKGLIDLRDYKLYIAAQLQMLKAIEIGNTHPNIGPWCLTGDKAWVRWKVWKKKYDNIGKSKTLKDVGLDKAKLEEVKKELDKTKKFMNSKFGPLTEDAFKLKAKEIERNISLATICGFYAALSPWVSKYCTVNIDLSYYQDLDEVAKTYFKSVFPEENLQ
jgi:hypothetical protein